MPRKYQSLMKHKTYSPEDIENALQLVNDGMSLRLAAETTGISLTVLFRRKKFGNTLKQKGGQTVLSSEEEKLIVNRLQICSEWGYPIDSFTLRLLVKDFLDRKGKNVKKFKNNLPGKDFVYSFLQRYKVELSHRLCQNIKRSRAEISEEVINDYFDNLQTELKDVPASNIVNYDETNLADDPGRKKVITRRGHKYPERVINSTKTSTSVIFSASGDGTILPPYVVYKAQHLYESWREGGPDNSRYNRTKSGWFDLFTFTDWVETVAIPYLRRLDGVKYLIGDNLASHLSIDMVKKCEDNNIKFIFLPKNSTHLTQPLDVAFFRPLKMSWRKILEEWKIGPGRYEATIPKDKFPSLLKKVFETCKSENVLSGFKKCGIIPLDRKKLLDRLPKTSFTNTPNQSTNTSESSVQEIDDVFKELLKNLRQGSDVLKTRKRRVKISVEAGKSVVAKDFEEPAIPQSQPSTSTGTVTSKKGAPKTRKKKRSAPSSEDDSSDYSLQDSDDDFSISELDEDDDQSNINTGTLNTQVSLFPEDFVVVKVFGKTQVKCRLYVCKVKDYEEGGYICQFFKKIPFAKKFVPTEEESFVRKIDVVKKLGLPVTASGSSRYNNMISFEEDDLTGLSIY
uniref:DDE-1 domain-containing protein n=1 Tax=Cuerna arida TaxID=1464854 RepID=A0A1B6GCB9_9HEMI